MKKTNERIMNTMGNENRLLDWGVALGGLWLISGLYLDGWAHHRIQLESFFTPWHAVLYSGFAFAAAVVGLGFVQGLRRVRSWQLALPRAYRASLFGAVLFFIGGIADMTWHTLLGIEAGLEALLSPPHLLLAVGGGLLITGPLRAALYRPEPPRSRPPRTPALLSLTNLVALIAFFTAYMHPFMEMSQRVLPGSLAFRLVPANPTQVVGAVLLQSTVLMFAVLLLARSFRLPFGSLTLLFTLTTALAVTQHENWALIPVGILAGLAADGLARALHAGQPGWGTRLFAFLVPALLYLFFFSAFMLEDALNWSLEFWGGTVILAGLAGWLLSYAFFGAEGD